MKKTYLSHMTWPEVREKVKGNPCVLVPVGTTETQNQHNPTGYDHIVAQRLAEEIALKANAVIAPVIPYGYSEIFTDYPGTITLKPETLQELLYDVTTSLIKTGFEHIFFLNNHEQNAPILGYTLQRIRKEYGLIFPSVFPSLISKEYGAKLFENPGKVQVHGNEPSTSLCAYLCPEYMRMDMAVDSELDFGGKSPFKLTPKRAYAHEGQSITSHLRVSDATPIGGFGAIDPKPEIGQKIFEQTVDYLVSFVDQFLKMDCHIKK